MATPMSPLTKHVTALLRLADRIPDSQSGDGGSNPSGEIMVRWQRWPNAPVLKTGSSW